MDKSHCDYTSEMPQDKHRMGPDHNTERFQLPSIPAPVSTALLAGLGHIEGQDGLGLAVGKHGA